MAWLRGLVGVMAAVCAIVLWKTCTRPEPQLVTVITTVSADSVSPDSTAAGKPRTPKTKAAKPRKRRIPTERKYLDEEIPPRE